MSQATLYHTIMLRAEAHGLGRRRSKLAQGLRGDVLEVGSGTGLMFRHYPPEARVWAIEPDPEFLALARPPANVRMIRASGLELPFPEARFDAAVIALVLCTVPPVERTLLEPRRVLKPGGELRLIEHVRSVRFGRLMDALNPLWLRLNGQGCNLNRDPVDALRRTGFNIAQLTCFALFPFPARVIRARL